MARNLSLAPSPLGEGGPTPPPSSGEGAGGRGQNPIYRRVFVGREQELRQLHAAFDAAISGQGGLAMVVGEPGIGKTAVIEQLATYVSLRGGKALIGHCYEEGSLSLPYLAFVEAMRSYVLARDPEGLRKDLGTGAADVARIVSEVRDKVTIDLRQSGDPEDDRWRLYQGITTFLRNASTVQPLLIVLEDLHWADKGTLDLLVHLARDFQGVRLLIIGTYRDVEVDRSHPLSGALGELRRGANFLRVPLRGLTAEEVQRMMSAIAGQEVPNSLAEAVHRQTEGNPLFIQEVLRYLVEEGMLSGGREGQAASATSLMERIPEGLRDVIGRRLARLSAECNRILAIAAVIGRDFRMDVLQQVATPSQPSPVAGEGQGRGQGDTVEAALEEAQGVGVIESQRGAGGMAFRFTHAFFRQTLYEEIFAPRRIRLHQQVARALELIYARRPEEHAAEMAEHFAQSTDAEDLRKALRYGELAAQRATSVFDYGEAVRHLERCLQVQEVLDPDDRAKRIDLLLALGEALMPAGELRRACEEAAEKAYALAEGMGDRQRSAAACELAVRALLRYGAVTSFSTPEGQEWARRADRTAAPSTRQRVWADIGMGISYNYQDRPRENRAAMEQALEGARRLGDPEATLTAVGVLGRLLPPTSAGLLQAVEELYVTPAAQAASYAAALFLWRAGELFRRYGQRQRSEEAHRRAAEMTGRLRDPQLEIFGLFSSATGLAIGGRLEEAEAAALALPTRGQKLGSPATGALYGAGAGFRPSLWLGHVEAAMAVQQGSASASRAEYLILCQGRLGQREETRQALRRRMGEVGMGAQQDGFEHVQSPILLEAAVLLEDREAAGQLLGHVTPFASLSYLATPRLVCPARVLGDAYALLGQREQARVYYLQALENCAKIGFRPEAALAHLGLAELGLGDLSPAPSPQRRGEEPVPSPFPLREGGRGVRSAGVGMTRAEAMGHLDTAIREFRDMKMQPSLERALKHRELLRA